MLYLICILAGRGYALKPTGGGGYIDASATVSAAREVGLTLEEFIYRHDDANKRGRIDRIVGRVGALFGPASPVSVAEIGTGTGMYMERLCKIVKCIAYHVFETDPGWQAYSRSTLCNHAATFVHSCDGMTLKELGNASVDLVHAHGVFVYTSSLVTLGYLAEAARVLKPGGKLCFDCYLDTNFGELAIEKWMASEHRFPVITVSKILFDHLQQNQLKIVSTFREVHGPDYVDYLVAQKIDEAITS